MYLHTALMVPSYYSDMHNSDTRYSNRRYSDNRYSDTVRWSGVNVLPTIFNT